MYLEFLLACQRSCEKLIVEFRHIEDIGRRRPVTAKLHLLVASIELLQQPVFLHHPMLLVVTMLKPKWQEVTRAVIQKLLGLVQPIFRSHWMCNDTPTDLQSRDRVVGSILVGAKLCIDSGQVAHTHLPRYRHSSLVCGVIKLKQGAFPVAYTHQTPFFLPNQQH